MLADLTDSLPWIATLAALGAFWVSCREVRRCNKVIVKLKKFRSYISETKTSTYELEVWVVNRGIQMQNISMDLSFDGPGKSGCLYIRIPICPLSSEAGTTFLRGTTARFILSSADKDLPAFLGSLQDIREQKPAIGFYSSSFKACSFCIYSRWDWFKRTWNKLGFRFRFERRVGEGAEGKGVYKMYYPPLFEIRSDRLQFFLDGLKKAGADDTTVTK